MELKMFSVYDNKAEAFLTPFFSPTTGLALRSFEEAVQTTDHQFHRHANDFCLYELGVFYQDTGDTKMLDQAINLGLAASLLRPEPIPLEEDL